MEQIGKAAQRLLAKMDARKRKASERLTTSSEQIGRDDLDRLFSGTGNAPAVPQIAADADERDPAIERDGCPTLSGLETASRANQGSRARTTGHLPEVVYVTWAGVAVVAGNSNHASALARLALTSSRPKPKASP